jgi:drug/metabolite transporter (DMT)-like permease
MIFLLLSILFSVITVSFFKLFERYSINTLQAIIGNYVVCILMGNIFAEKSIILTPFWNQPWFLFAFVLGFLFITIFYAIGKTTQEMGVSVSMVAAKLSVMIPVIFAVWLHNEHITIIKIIGIVISLFAVYFISKKEQATTPLKKAWLLPIIVFVGSGIIDTLLKFIEANYIPPANAGDIVSTIFLIAFLLGIPIIIYQYIQHHSILKFKNIVWGFALGVPNYFSMFFLVKTLENYNASHIFPINNIGIVVCSTLLSLIVFNEKLSRTNWIGFALAIVSILIISLS